MIVLVDSLGLLLESLLTIRLITILNENTQLILKALKVFHFFLFLALLKHGLLNYWIVQERILNVIEILRLLLLQDLRVEQKLIT